LYGGIGILCAPLNDAWILTIGNDISDEQDISTVNSVSFEWEYYPLRYDHGEVRCWHAHCCINSGLVQKRQRLKLTVKLLIGKLIYRIQ